MIPRSHLFGNPVKANAQISPDGKNLAWLAAVDEIQNIWVAPTNAADTSQPVTQEKRTGISWYLWAYDSYHILYTKDSGGDENFHIFAVNIYTLATKDLTPFGQIHANIVSISKKIRDEILISLNQRDKRFPDLYRVNLKTGALVSVAENPGFSWFLTDDNFVPRLGVRSTVDGSREVLRRDEVGIWNPWITFLPEDARISEPTHLDATGQNVFFRDSRDRDTAALTKVDFTTGCSTVIADHPKVDINCVLTDINTYEPLVYSIMVERLEYIAIDSRVQQDLDFLTQQGLGDWTLHNRSEDDRFWVLSASSDIQPNTTYLYDRTAVTLKRLYCSRPALLDAPLSQMHTVTIRSRDDLALVSYLTLPKKVDPKEAVHPYSVLPMVLLVHGGPWQRDVFGYNAVHQWLSNRGYAVLSVNFRGSIGFGKAFVNAGDLEWGNRMDDDLLDAVNWAIEQKIADPTRIAIMGWSYGGYATLVGLTRNPETYACGIDVVGPSNLETFLKTFPPYWEAERAAIYRAVGNPDVDADLVMIRDRSPLFHVEQIKRPLLIVQGVNDPRVNKAESDQMVAAMVKQGIPVTYLVYMDEGHGFIKPENTISFTAVAEAFLEKYLGGSAEPISTEEIRRSTMKVIRNDDNIDLPIHTST